MQQQLKVRTERPTTPTKQTDIKQEENDDGKHYCDKYKKPHGPLCWKDLKNKSKAPKWFVEKYYDKKSDK